MAEQPAPTTAEARKAEAAAQIAELEAKKARLEFEEWKAAAALRKKTAQAALQATLQKNTDAERSATKDLIPDLSGVDRGETTTAEGTALFDALLGGRALQDAARKLAGALDGDPGLGENFRVLVTTDMDLSTRGSDYSALLEKITLLTNLIEGFRQGEVPRLGIVGGPLLSAAAVGAQLLPGLLSLLSANRHLSSSTSTLNDDVVLMAVAGVLAGADAGSFVVADRTRLTGSTSAIHKAWQELVDACNTLRGDLTALEAEDDPPAERIAEGKALLDTCQTATTALVTVPEGGSTSPLAGAAAQEVLHSAEISSILIVKGVGASSTQLVNDRPLWAADPVSIISTATISYLLIDHHNGSRVLTGGLVHGIAEVHGKIGSRLSGFA